MADPEQFEPIVAGSLLEQEVARVARLAVDGEVMRGSKRGNGKPGVPHCTVSCRRSICGRFICVSRCPRARCPRRSESLARLRVVWGLPG